MTIKCSCCGKEFEIENIDNGFVIETCPHCDIKVEINIENAKQVQVSTFIKFYDKIIMLIYGLILVSKIILPIYNIYKGMEYNPVESFGGISTILSIILINFIIRGLMKHDMFWRIIATILIIINIIFYFI
jgi:DNA-directed RNA polymerase subunit RPC12/RpoP